MAESQRCGIMDILYVIDHDLVGKPLTGNTSTDSTSNNMQPGQRLQSDPSTSPQNEGTTEEVNFDPPNSPNQQLDYQSSGNGSPMPIDESLSYSPPYPSLASTSDNNSDISPIKASTIPPAQLPPSTRPPRKTSRGGHGKEYWTQHEDTHLISLVKHYSTDGRKHWKKISSSMLMQRSPEACRTRWKILAKDLRKFTAEEEDSLKSLLNELEPKLHEICAEKMRKSPEEIRDAIPFLGKPRPKEEREESEASSPRHVVARRRKSKYRRLAATAATAAAAIGDSEDDEFVDESPPPPLKRSRYLNRKHKRHQR